MDITTLAFLIFLCAAVILYYLLPRKASVGVLLVTSLAFTCMYNAKGLIFVILTSLSIWLAGRKIGHLNDDQNQEPAQIKSKQKRAMLITLFFNIGVLVLLKYITPQFEHSAMMKGLQLLVPLGLSYYTLQAVSYVLDVYWKRIEPEKSYAKMLLFVCYFPQLIQGPISRYKDFSGELKKNTFDPRSLKYGVQLMLWGYFKVMVIGKNVSKYVENIFFGKETAYGFAVFIGLVLFGFELYANFSGGIDVIRGASQCFGINLAENFRQPFFSKSLGEFWRRWHITLGAWMKDYVFYPFSMSRAVSKTKKHLKKHMSRKMANRIPMAVANVVVFLLVGIWHGTGTNYALWGLYNGIILAFSELMADVYANTKKKLHINDKSKAWNAFCLFRTFIIVTIGWCTDCAVTALGSAELLKNMLYLGRTNLDIIGIETFDLIKISAALVLLLGVSIFHEKKGSVREWMGKKNFAVQVIVWTILIQLIACFGRMAGLGGFIYAGF